MYIHQQRLMRCFRRRSLAMGLLQMPLSGPPLKTRIVHVPVGVGDVNNGVAEHCPEWF